MKQQGHGGDCAGRPFSTSERYRRERRALPKRSCPLRVVVRHAWSPLVACAVFVLSGCGGQANADDATGASGADGAGGVNSAGGVTSSADGPSAGGDDNGNDCGHVWPCGGDVVGTAWNFVQACQN